MVDSYLSTQFSINALQFLRKYVLWMTTNASHSISSADTVNMGKAEQKNVKIQVQNFEKKKTETSAPNDLKGSTYIILC